MCYPIWPWASGAALALSAHGPFGPARFARGLDKVFYATRQCGYSNEENTCGPIKGFQAATLRCIINSEIHQKQATVSDVSLSSEQEESPVQKPFPFGAVTYDRRHLIGGCDILLECCRDQSAAQWFSCRCIVAPCHWLLCTHLCNGCKQSNVLNV